MFQYIYIISIDQKLMCPIQVQEYAYLRSNTTPTPHTGNTRNQPTCLCWTIRSVNPVWTFPPSEPQLSQQKSRDYIAIICSLIGRILFFLCSYRKKYCFSPAMISIKILLWSKASYVWSFNNLMFFSFCRWFVMCLIYVPHPEAKTGIRRWGLALLIGPNWVCFTWRQRQNLVSETLGVGK
jgi:hypothetical protein